MKKSLSIFLFLLLCCCTKRLTVRDSSTGISKENVWGIGAKRGYFNEKEVRISITNSTDESLILYRPMEKYVERQKENGEWTRIGIQYCACGDCAPPPDMQDVAPGYDHVFLWDKSIVHCENGRKEIYDVPKGKYRVTFFYSRIDRQEMKKLVINFDI